MKTITYRNLRGLKSIQRTLKLIERAVEESKVDPFVYVFARKLTNRLKPKDYLTEIRVVHEFVRDKIRYARDPTNHEVVANAKNTLKIGAGDCDDKTVLVRSLLESLGHRTRSVVSGHSKEFLKHVYPEVFLKKWVAIETTADVELGKTDNYNYRIAWDNKMNEFGSLFGDVDDFDDDNYELSGFFSGIKKGLKKVTSKVAAIVLPDKISKLGKKVEQKVIRPVVKNKAVQGLALAATGAFVAAPLVASGAAKIAGGGLLKKVASSSLAKKAVPFLKKHVAPKVIDKTTSVIQSKFAKYGYGNQAVQKVTEELVNSPAMAQSTIEAVTTEILPHLVGQFRNQGMSLSVAEQQALRMAPIYAGEAYQKTQASISSDDFKKYLIPIGIGAAGLVLFSLLRR